MDALNIPCIAVGVRAGWGLSSLASRTERMQASRSTTFRRRMGSCKRADTFVLSSGDKASPLALRYPHTRTAYL